MIDHPCELPRLAGRSTYVLYVHARILIHLRFAETSKIQRSRPDFNGSCGLSRLNRRKRGGAVSLVSIVSEDALLRQSVKALVESAGLQANTFPTLQAMLDSEEAQSRGCLVFHSVENALNDPAQQKRLRVACTSCLAILVTERDNVRTAVQAMKAGVRSVVQEPYRDSELLEHIKTLVDSSETV